jgi:hypothetical protein
VGLGRNQIRGAAVRVTMVALVVLIAPGAVACVGPAAPSASSPELVSTNPPASFLATPAPSSQPDETIPGPSLEPLPSLALPAGWRSTTLPGIDFGPQLAVSNDRLYLAGTNTARDVLIWESSDGLSWRQLRNPGVAMGFNPSGMIGDGHGGLLLAGELGGTGSFTPQIWFSSDGATFTKANLGGVDDPTATPPVYPIGQLVGLASAHGTFLALGKGVNMSPDSSTGLQSQLVVWRSTDGRNWTAGLLPDSADHAGLSVTAWKRGFAVLASRGDTDATEIWLSSDGATWRKGSHVAPSSRGPIVGFGDRLVVPGLALGDPALEAAIWSSTDGQTWQQSTVPASGVAVAFDDLTVIGNRLIAMGMSHLVLTVDTGQAGAAAATPTDQLMGPTFWGSADGATWRILAPAPFYQDYAERFLPFGGHLVSATVVLGRAIVSVGDLP